MCRIFYDSQLNNQPLQLSNNILRLIYSNSIVKHMQLERREIDQMKSNLKPQSTYLNVSR